MVSWRVVGYGGLCIDLDADLYTDGWYLLCAYFRSINAAPSLVQPRTCLVFNIPHGHGYI